MSKPHLISTPYFFRCIEERQTLNSIGMFYTYIFEEDRALAGTSEMDCKTMHSQWKIEVSTGKPSWQIGKVYQITEACIIRT